jgi:RNA polymerase sigma-70 factor, ECF subfamily
MTNQHRQQVHVAMVRLAEGDREAFDEVFDELWPELLAFTRRALPGGTEVEDLAQQTLLKVFSRISEFDSARDGVAWAFGIAAYEIRTHRRRLQRRREVAGAFDGLTDSARSQEQALVDNDLAHALTAALAELSTSDRAILVANRPERPGPVGPTERKRRQRAIERLRTVWRRLYA